MVIKIKSPNKGSPSKGEVNNPLKTDEELVDLLNRLDRIKTYKRFQGWKESFLAKFETYLAQPGIENATKRSEDFKTLFNKMHKFVDKVDANIEKGDLTNDKVTVKGRNSLNELCKNLTISCDETEAFLPSTKTDEKQCGFNKFQLGAVLVRDGFSCYDNMKYLDDECTKLRVTLPEVADSQQLELFEYYQKKFKKFCDVMADLGLYEVMLACRKFAIAPDYDEPDMMEITVKCSNGQNITMEIDSSETIGNVKEAIKDACGIPPEKQILKFRNKPLNNNNETLFGAGIEDQSILTVSPPTVPIIVNTMDGKKIKVDVDPSEPLGQIKKSLQEKTGLPPDNQRLFFNGKELDDDNKPATDYGIKEGSELDLEPKTMKISVDTPDGKKIYVLARPSDTAQDIKKKVEDQTGMPPAKQVLEHNGKEFPNDKTIKDMGVQDGDNLNCKIAKIPITVKTLDGTPIKIMVDPDDSLGDIKKQLEDESGLPVKKMHLYMNGKPLDDDTKKPADYGIKAGSVLEMKRVIFFLDADTGAIGKLPVDKVGEDVISANTTPKGPARDAIKKQMQKVLD